MTLSVIQSVHEQYCADGCLHNCLVQVLHMWSWSIALRCTVCDCGVLCSRFCAQQYCTHHYLHECLVQVLCMWYGVLRSRLSAHLFGAGALYVIVEYCAHVVCTTVWCRCSVCDHGVLCSRLSAHLFGAGALYVIVEYCAHCYLHNCLV